MTVAKTVRYKTKPECAEENERLIRDVFAEAEQNSPDGVHYAAFRLDDGVSFLHVVVLDGEENPLTKLAAFAEFQSGIAERCVEGPTGVDATVVGSYRMVTGRPQMIMCGSHTGDGARSAHDHRWRRHRAGYACCVLPLPRRVDDVRSLGFSWSLQQQLVEPLGWSLPVEGFAGSEVELVGDEVDVFAGVDGQVGAFGEVLAEQPVGVLVAAALPG